MGVKTCSRKNCANIMCDTYVDSIGYVCNACQEEFKNYLKENSLNPKTKTDYIYYLSKFIDTPKDHYIDNGDMTVDEFFKQY